MKRFTLIVALALMVTMPLFAEKVTPETARKVATTFLNNNGAKTAQLTDLSKAAGFPNLYIFTAEKGFVVMAADNRVKPILGYSLTGNFTAEDMPENVRFWLQGYNDEIQDAIKNQASASYETIQLWNNLERGNSAVSTASPVVSPIIQTKWNQTEYYNIYCPQANGGPGGRAYTGCVATAMAQIMKYYNYPSRGIGSHSYSWNGQTLSADFGSTTYDWDNMANYYGYYYENGTDQYPHGVSNTNTQKLAVSMLMYHCGVAVDMNYGGGGSGTATLYVAEALKSYFNYSTDIEYKVKSQYSDDQWITMVKAELDENRPLEYCGIDPNSSAGHAFVCDGYDNANYFHFNWGWSGCYDGYFSLDDLNTGANNQSGSGNGNYTKDQAAIFGIQPVQCAASDPSDLTFTPNSNQSYTLNWTEANGAASYNIYHNGIYIGNSISTSYNVIVPFGTNVYYVRSVDANGNLSLSSNSVTIDVTYQVPNVNDLEASLSDNNVSLTWSTPEWCYPETPSATLTYGNGNYYSSLGYNGNANMYWGHRYPTSILENYSGMILYKISFYVSTAGTYQYFIYKGTNTYNVQGVDYPIPETQIANATFTTAETGWFDIDLNEYFAIDETQDLWVFLFDPEHKNYPAALCTFSEHTDGSYFSIDNPTSTILNTYNGTAFLIRTLLTDGTYTYNLYHDGERIAENLTENSYSSVALNYNAANQFMVKTNYYGGEAPSNTVGYVKGSTSLSSMELGTNDKMTLTEGSTLIVSGNLTNTNPDNLILEDNAKLIHNSDNIAATVKKNITAYSGNGGWYLLASPMTDNLVASDVTGLLGNNYDLYIFNQSEGQEWRNYKANSFSTLDHKTGYLYANNSNTTLTFIGTLAASADATPLVYDGNATLKGFNLIGNPYPCNTYVTGRSFYVLNENGSEFVVGSNPIPPCSAILVQADDAGESVTFSKTEPIGIPSLTFSVINADTRNSVIEDKARVSFSEADRLMKYNLNTKSTRLYIPQNGHDFAVAYTNGENELPLNFKAAQSGTYTLNFDSENLDLDYLHLIDNRTGDDVDLLATPTYTFAAKSTDYTSRFRLVFKNNGPLTGSGTEGSETFAFNSNGEWIINNEGNATLQVIDAQGHQLSNQEIHSAFSIPNSAFPTSGVYVLRLITANNVKIQKIVIE